jgi:hypothetical protein
MDIGQVAVREIHAFHQFLEGWLSGRESRDETLMVKRLDAFHADFVYVTPSAPAPAPDGFATLVCPQPRQRSQLAHHHRESRNSPS